jgi:anti-sigma factor RsiW
MTHDDLDRRIQDELDGVATAEESAELRRRLEASPAARARFDEMKAVFRMLDRVETVEPPPALKERVILGLPPAPAPSRRGVLGAAFRRRGGLGWGYSFAAGLAAGVLVVILANGVQRPGSSEEAKYSGSMAPLAGRDAAIVDEVRLELDGNAATAETRSAGADVLVRIESAAPDGDLVVGYDPGAFVLQSFHQSDAASGPVELDPGRIHVRNAGQARFDFTLRPAGSGRPPLQVSIQSGDRVVTRALQLGPARKE